MFEKFFKKYGEYFYFVFRVLVGLLFALHGAKKFGWFGGTAVDLLSLMGLAGTIELIAGLAIALGFLTRLASMLGAAVMLVAYFKLHLPQGWDPLLNQGELALLYFVAFLVLMTFGAKKWCIKSLLFGK